MSKNNIKSTWIYLCLIILFCSFQVIWFWFWILNSRNMWSFMRKMKMHFSKILQKLLLSFWNWVFHFHLQNPGINFGDKSHHILFSKRDYLEHYCRSDMILSLQIYNNRVHNHDNNIDFRLIRNKKLHSNNETASLKLNNYVNQSTLTTNMKNWFTSFSCPT